MELKADENFLQENFQNIFYGKKLIILDSSLIFGAPRIKYISLILGSLNLFEGNWGVTGYKKDLFKFTLEHFVKLDLRPSSELQKVLLSEWLFVCMFLFVELFSTVSSGKHCN